MIQRWPLAVAALAFVLVATANSAGYRYGVSDQAFYIPALALGADDSLFPRDRDVFAPQMSRWLGDEFSRWASAVLPLDGAAIAGVWYVTTLVVMFAGVTSLARRFGADWWTTAAVLAVVTLRHRIAKTGANSLEGYALPRTMAFAIGLVALSYLLQQKKATAWILAGVAILVHTTTGLWIACALAGAMVWEWRPSAGRFMTLLTAAALATLVTVRLAMSRGLERMDGTWTEVLTDKDYLFPAEWPLYAWALNLSYAAIILIVHAARRRSGREIPGESALVAGLMALVAIFLVSVPLTMTQVAIAVQLQVNRVFWILDAFVAIYAVTWIAGWASERVGVRGRQVIAAALVATALARGYYVLRVETDRPLFAWRIPQTTWTDALAWLRTQPATWHVLSDPGHVWKYSVGVRLGAFRDTPLDTSKDSAMAIYDRSLALRVAEYGRALARFDDLTLNDVRALDDTYQFDVLLDRSDRTFNLPVLFRNDGFVVYDLR